MTSIAPEDSSPPARRGSRRRVDLLLPSLNAGGAQQVFITLSRLLADHHDVRLVVVDASGPLRSELPSELEIVDLNRSGVSRALPALVRHLRRSAPEVVLSSIDHTNLLALAAAKLARSQATVLPRVANTPSHPLPHPTVSDVVIRYGIRTLYPRLRAIIAPGYGVASDLVALGIPESTVRVIPNPVVGPSLLAAAEQPLDHPWFGPTRTRAVPVIVAMGRLVPQKDFGMLIEAWASLRARQRTRLVILGDGPERNALADLASRSGGAEDFQLAGYVHNPAPFLAAADLFVLSSRWEGLPGVLIQALACGTPVVATDCESGPREILDEGRYGRLVPVGDAEALTVALEQCLAEPVAPAPAAWRPYSEEAALTRYLDLIEEFAPPARG